MSLAVLVQTKVHFSPFLPNSLHTDVDCFLTRASLSLTHPLALFRSRSLARSLSLSLSLAFSLSLSLSRARALSFSLSLPTLALSLSLPLSHCAGPQAGRAGTTDQAITDTRGVLLRCFLTLPNPNPPRVQWVRPRPVFCCRSPTAPRGTSPIVFERGALLRCFSTRCRTGRAQLDRL